MKTISDYLVEGYCPGCGHYPTMQEILRPQFCVDCTNKHDPKENQQGATV